MTRSIYTGGLDVIRKEAGPFYRTSSGVRLCWELGEPEEPKGSNIRLRAEMHLFLDYRGTSLIRNGFDKKQAEKFLNFLRNKQPLFEKLLIF